MAKSKREDATVVGLIFIGMGSSWYQGTDDVKTAVQCAKICRADWKHLFKFEKDHAFPVNLFDISNCPEGWYATDRGVFCSKTKQKLDRKKLMWVVR
jgi:hypothetical protein